MSKSSKSSPNHWRRQAVTDNDPSASPKTPIPQSRDIPNRPLTGTPAPWASSRLSVLARIPPVKRTELGEDVDQHLKPVYVGEFPHVVRDDQQATLMTKQFPGDMFISGGLDKEMSLAWVIWRNRLFIWSYLSHNSCQPVWTIVSLNWMRWNWLQQLLAKRCVW